MRMTRLLFGFAAMWGSLHATTVFIGTADTLSGNAFPFGGGGTTYQQVYAASDFSGLIDISGISFFRTSQFSSPTDTIANATYTIKLSYSANAVNALDTSVFSNNVGAGLVTFGTYVLSGVLVGSGITFTQNNSDFIYNPSNGPLLLEIDLSSIGTSGSASLDAMNGDAGGLFSRAHNFGGGFSDFGLVTQFTSSAVPEPGTVGFVALGAGLFLLRRRT